MSTTYEVILPYVHTSRVFADSAIIFATNKIISAQNRTLTTHVIYLCSYGKIKLLGGKLEKREIQAEYYFLKISIFVLKNDSYRNLYENKLGMFLN